MYTPKKLLVNDIKTKSKFIKKVLSFDPNVILESISFNSKKRIQKLKFDNMFPKVEGRCSCGCDVALVGRRTRWATKDCNKFAYAIYSIFCGHNSHVKHYLKYCFDWNCCVCGSTKQINIDHIIPVKHGGGCCWLDNYQLLCHPCHVKKTKKDFGWK